jgi:hypothetical protein
MRMLASLPTVACFQPYLTHFSRRDLVSSRGSTPPANGSAWDGAPLRAP